MNQNPEGQGQKSVVGGNQSNPTSAAPSGAIFSGSSAPTGTAPAGTPNQPTSGGSRPFFAHHPTHTFSREMGDIVVGGTPQKKSKKPLIIIIIALIITAIAVTLAIVVLSLSSSRSAAYIQDFRVYASLLVTGTPTQDFSLDSYNISNGFYAQDTLRGDGASGAHEYFLALQNQFNTVVSSLTEANITETTLLETIESNRSLLDYFVDYTSVTPPTTAELIEVYNQHGYQEAKAYIEDLFAPFVENESADIQAFGHNKVEQYNAVLEYIRYYQACISDGEIDNACVSALPPNQELEARLQNADTQANLENQSRDASLRMLLDNCYVMNADMITGATNE